MAPAALVSKGRICDRSGFMPFCDMKGRRLGEAGSKRGRFISGARVTPRKSLGQNFLQDENIARWIADQVEPESADLVVEAGPGLGALTQHLEGRARRLLLLEKDDELAQRLREEHQDREDVDVWHGDAAKVDLRSWYQAGEVRVVGNLPYSVGGEILKRFLTVPTPVHTAVFMLQKEVCERLVAKQGEHGFGGLSLLVQKDWHAELLRVVPPDVFKPRPKVDSAVVRFSPRAPSSLPVFDRRSFDRLVRMGFSQRRKQLKNLLPEPPDSWGELTRFLGKAETLRAEELTLEEWVELSRWYEGRAGAADAGQKASELFDVVDENNQVVEQRTRGEVHAQGLRHRAVHVFVLNKKGEVFLHQRSHLKDVAPLKWDSSAAGHLDVGESYGAAAIRECGEELGIALDGTECASCLPASEKTDQEFIELHVARHNGPMRCLPEEVRCGDWFAKGTVDSWVEQRPADFARGFVSCWEAWRSS